MLDDQNQSQNPIPEENSISPSNSILTEAENEPKIEAQFVFPSELLGALVARKREVCPTFAKAPPSSRTTDEQAIRHRKGIETVGKIGFEFRLWRENYKASARQGRRLWYNHKKEKDMNIKTHKKDFDGWNVQKKIIKRRNFVADQIV